MSSIRNSALVAALLLSFAGVVQAAAPGVREIPLPAGAADVSYMRSRGDIRFQVPGDMKAAGNFYATTLAAQQWTKAKRDNLQKSFWVQTFAKTGLTLEVRVDQRGAGCEIRLTPQGFAWDEDLAPRPEDLPIPDDAKEVEYDDFFERIEFQSAAAPERLAEFYAAKLDAKTWSPSGADVVTPDVVKLERTAGKASVTVTVRKDDAVSEVTIKTRGMAWDKVKAANEAQEAAAKLAAKSSPAAPTKVELPQRVEKPARGLAQLEKLTSSCVLTVDGTPIQLPHVLAYECVSQGEWCTKIVATESEVSQKALLQRLKETGSDEGWNLKAPYLKLELDDQDRPTSLAVFADMLAGTASGRDLAGEAIVEGGRARGTVKQTEPKSFFDKEYSAEITFDVPVLTRDSTPAKRLVGAAQLPNVAKLTVGGKTLSLRHATVYESRRFDEVVTTVLLTERPANLAKLKASLARPEQNDDDHFEFQPQIKLVVDDNEQIASLFIWCDNLSISGSGWDKIKSSIVVEDGRARGTAKTTASEDAFGKKVDFEVSFDATVLPLPVKK